MNATLAKLGGLAARGGSLIVGQDGARAVFGFRPLQRLNVAQGEVESPEGFFADGNVMYVLSGGTQDRIFAFEMPRVPSAPYWANTSGAPLRLARLAAMQNLVIPAVTRGDPDPTYAASGLPSGVVFNTATRTLSGTPSASESGTIVITAENQYGTARYTIQYRVEGAVAPSWTAAGGTAETWYVDNQVRYTFPAVDAGYPPPTYSIAGQPTGFAFDAATRVLSGTPTETQSGTSGTITVTATSPTNATDTWTLAWSIAQPTEAPRAPFWGAPLISAPTWTQDAAITTLRVPAVDAGSPAPAYAALDLPSGLVFDSTALTISGAPLVFGTGTIRIVAINASGEATFRITYNIMRSTVARAPSWFTAQGLPQSFGRGAFVSIQIPEADRGYPPPVYTADGLPTGIVFNPATRVLSGTPTEIGEAGTISVTATNASGTATYTIVWTVVDSPPRWIDERGPAVVWVVGRNIPTYQVPRA